MKPLKEIVYEKEVLGPFFFLWRLLFRAIVEWKYVSNLNGTRVASLLISHLDCCSIVGCLGGRVVYEIDIIVCLQPMYIRVGGALSHMTT